jgi:hypothetical protein
MAERTPNYDLERAQIELQIAEMDLSMRRMHVRKLQLDDERARIDENEAATVKHKAELRTQLDGMVAGGAGKK